MFAAVATIFKQQPAMTERYERTNTHIETRCGRGCRFRLFVVLHLSATLPVLPRCALAEHVLLPSSACQIIRAKLHYPAYLSADARGILQALLDRNPKTRLGSVNDAEDVKRHPFFAGLDWAKLQRLELTAPFKPSVTEGDQDTTNVDEEFKRETPKDTPVTQSTLATAQGVQFPGFSFQAPDSNLAAQPSVLKDAPE